MNVAIIDEIVNQDYIPKLRLKKSFTVDGNIVKEHVSVRKEDTHGTTCAAIINKYAPSAKIIAIQAISRRNGQVACLVKALEWCLYNDVDIIQMSLGSIQFSDFSIIKKVINELLNKDIIIVAAKHNDDIYTVPASLPGVFSVKSSKACLGQEIIVEDNTFTNLSLLACGNHSLVNCFGHIYTSPSSNSFAAPVVSAVINNILDNKPIGCRMKNWKYCIQKICAQYKMAIKETSFLGTIDFFTEADICGMKLNENILPFTLSKKSKTFIFVPHDDSAFRDLEKYIEVNNYQNLIYAGKLKKTIKQWLDEKMEGFVIDESMWDLQEKKIDKSFLIETPIIGVIDNDFAVGLIKKLNNLFCEQEYYSITCSSIKYGYLYGNYYIPFYMNNQLKEWFLSELAKEYQCDIFIYHIREDDSAIKLCDYIIDTSQTQTDASVVEIYQNIIRLFT